MSSHSSLSLILCVALSALLCSSTARGQLAVAFFDYFDPFNFKQSYLVSNDGLTFEGVVYFRDKSPQNGSLEVKFCDTGDIASQSGLDACPELPRHTVGFTCLANTDTCSVKLESVPLSACDHIGKAIIIDFFTEPYHIPLPVQSYRLKAVVGFGNVSSADCPFARKPFPLESAPAIVRMTGTGNSPGFAAQGVIVFQQLGRAMSVSGFLTNLPKSSTLGINLHQFGDIRDNLGASTTGMHFMFSGQQHGLVSVLRRHTGDLGNIMSDELGNSAFNILVPLDINTGPILTLTSQNGSAIGRSIILHTNADDGVTLRISQGVVGYAKNVTQSDVLALLNQGYVNQGFHCACTLCSAAGVKYDGFCSKSDCNLPPPKCSPPSRLAATSPMANCSIMTAFVLGSSVVAVFNSSSNCTFPFFPHVVAPTLLGSGNNYSVTTIAIGGGGGGGANGGGGGGAGGVVIHTSNISQGDNICIVVGAGGCVATPWFLGQTAAPATPGGDTVVTFPASNIAAMGGGFGGTRYYDYEFALGGAGASGGGGGGGNKDVCPGGAGFQSQGNAGGMGFSNECFSAGAGGGGFSTAGTPAAWCFAGNGGDGYQLPFEPIVSSWVAGGGAGGLTCFSVCSGDRWQGSNGLGQRGFGGGGIGGCNNGYQYPLNCSAQNGFAGAAFLQYSFVCADGYRQVQSVFFSGSPCEPLPPLANTAAHLPQPPITAAFASTVQTLLSNPAQRSISSCEAPSTSSVTPLVSSSAAPLVSSSAAPLVSSSAAPLVSSSAAPLVSPSAAPLVSSSAAPLVSSSAAPLVSSSAAPLVSSSAAPLVSSSAAPLVSSSAAPLVSSSAAPLVSSSAAYFSNTSMPMSTTGSSIVAPNMTSSRPASSVPTWIVVTAAVTSGHVPRALELVQFLSIYCTSLSSQQQSRVSEFQVASFTHIATSKAEYCGVCPGLCSRPLVLVVPTFALLSCLFALCLLLVIFDTYKSRNQSRFAMQEYLLEASAASSAAAADGRSSLRWNIPAFCAQYFRGLIETCSAYVLMPCTFVFVLNVRPSSFAQADSSERAMIVILPVVTLMFRGIVISQRVVPLTSADQKQMYVSSACSCFIAAVISVYFDRAAAARQSAPLFASNSSPQYIVLALLVAQIITQTVIRFRATEESIFDNAEWPWSSATSHASSAVFLFDDLVTRLVIGSVKNSSAAVAIAGAKLFLLNYMALSQIAMVVAGLASASSTSPSSIESSSAIIGSIPLVTSGVLLLCNVAKLVKLLWQKCCRRHQTSARRSSRDSFL